MNRQETQTPREIALDLLLVRERTHGDITELLKDALAGAGASLSVQEKAFLKRLAVGTVEKLLTIDAVIDHVASVKVKAMKPTVRNVIRLGTSQILYLDAVPDAAAVSETVNIVKKRGLTGLSGFTNAVLRRISKDRDKLLTYVSAAGPSVKYSMPPYLCGLFLSERGQEEMERIFSSLQESRSVSIRPDPRLVRDPDRYRKWEDAFTLAVGSVRHHPLLRDLLLAEDTGDIRRLPGYAEGAFAVQDAASALAVAACGIRPSDRVLDVCAAPGGKSLYAAALLEDPSQLTARDVSADKVALIRENADRMRLSGIRTQEWDATVFDEASREQYDVVLCDLPCSGFGVMGRKPEIRYSASKGRTESLARLQRQILDTVWTYVKPGGILLYSTCTVSRAENEDNVRWFLENHPFEGESWIDSDLPGALRGRAENGCLQILPGDYEETDGFFIARLRRVE